MPKPASTRPAYKMLTCIYLCRTLLFFAPYADFFMENHLIGFNTSIRVIFHCMAGFQNIDSKMARAADGVIMS